jgi:hypothetical protein
MLSPDNKGSYELVFIRSSRPLFTLKSDFAYPKDGSNKLDLMVLLHSPKPLGEGADSYVVPNTSSLNFRNYSVYLNIVRSID